MTPDAIRNILYVSCGITWACVALLLYLTSGPGEIISATAPASPQKSQMPQWQTSADKIADHATLSPPGNQADQTIERADDAARRGK
jgi:hypothetical protein